MTRRLGRFTATLLLSLGLPGFSVALAQRPLPAASAAGSSARPATSLGAPPLRSARPLSDAELLAPPPHDPERVDDGGRGHGAEGSPHGGHGADGLPGGPRQSKSEQDGSLAPGTIAVEVRDGTGKLLPDVDVGLGIVVNSVAKGESRERRSGKSNGEGVALFESLEIASTTAYRVTVVRDGATYAAPPFGLPKAEGMRATIVVYPVSREVTGMQLAIQAFVFVEIKDEVLVIEQAFRVFNLGQTTWVPQDVILSLPPGFKALNVQQQMSDVGVDVVKDRGVRLRGTYPPGQSEASFRYQVPNTGQSELTLPFGLPPQVQSMQVVVEATKGLTVAVPGFSEPVARQGENGVRLLGAVRETDKPDPLFRSAEIRLGNLPTKPEGRYWAAAIALGVMGVGLTLSLQKKRADDTEGERAELLAARDRLLLEIEGLEAAHAAGEVGPKTYARARRDLVEALAGVLVRLGA